MRVLAVYELTSEEQTLPSAIAYVHRARRLLEGLTRQGASVDEVFLGDWRNTSFQALRMLAYPRLRRLAREYDCVYAAGTVSGAAASLARRAMKTPCIFDMHGYRATEMYFLYRQERGLRAYLRYPAAILSQKLAEKWIDKILVVSEPARRILLQRGVKEQKLALIRNGVDLQRFSPVPLPPMPPVRFGYAGSMVEWQGIPILIEGIERFLKLNPDTPVHFDMMGFTQTEADKRLQKTIQRRLGSKVSLYAVMPQDQAIQRLQACHWLLITAHPESAHWKPDAFPTKFAEYLALKRPIIHMRAYESADLTQQYQCGLVCEPTPQGVADALAEAMNMPNPALEAQAERGRHLIEEHFDYRKIQNLFFKEVEQLTRI